MAGVGRDAVVAVLFPAQGKNVHNIAMDSDDSRTITRLLHRAALGDLPARDKLYSTLYRELSRIARSHLSRAGTISLDAPAILHDSFMRMEGKVPQGEFANRKVFFGYASTVMRNVIVDYVRERRAQKRGAGERELTLNTGIAETILAEDGILDLHEALSELERIDPRGRRVVEMRYFAGMTEEEIANVLEVSVPTVKRDWRKARAYLFDYLRDDA
jgi:RNA polymerase sigma factor (TIGR02999 family)